MLGIFPIAVLDSPRPRLKESEMDIYGKLPSDPPDKPRTDDYWFGGRFENPTPEADFGKGEKMKDPTYERAEIEANPVWFIAWIISEHLNDNAPLGWSRYIGAANSILDHFDVKTK